MTSHLKISMDTTQKIWTPLKLLFPFLCTNECQIPKNKDIHWNLWNKGFQRGYPRLQLKSGFLPLRADFAKRWMNSPHFLNSVFVHLSSFAILSRLAAASKDSNFSNSNFEQNLSQIMFGPAQGFLLSKGYLISAYFLFLHCHWKLMYFLLDTGQFFLSELPALPLAFALLPTVGENRRNAQDWHQLVH